MRPAPRRTGRSPSQSCSGRTRPFACRTCRMRARRISPMVVQGPPGIGIQCRRRPRHLRRPHRGRPSRPLHLRRAEHSRRRSSGRASERPWPWRRRRSGDRHPTPVVRARSSRPAPSRSRDVERPGLRCTPSRARRGCSWRERGGRWADATNAASATGRACGGSSRSARATVGRANVRHRLIENGNQFHHVPRVCGRKYDDGHVGRVRRGHRRVRAGAALQACRFS